MLLLCKSEDIIALPWVYIFLLEVVFSLTLDLFVGLDEVFSSNLNSFLLVSVETEYLFEYKL